MLVLLASSLASHIHAQNLTFEQADGIFGNQRILKFRHYSLELTDESKKELKALSDLIRITPALVKNTVLVIQIFTCEKELNVKPYIGVCRGQVIIDYLEKSIGMPRKKCLIRDTGASSFDKECLAGSGGNLYLKPNWRGKD